MLFKICFNVYVIQNLQRSAFFQTDLFTHPPTQHLLIIASLASTRVIKVHLEDECGAECKSSRIDLPLHRHCTFDNCPRVSSPQFNTNFFNVFRFTSI